MMNSYKMPLNSHSTSPVAEGFCQEFFFNQNHPQVKSADQFHPD